MKKIIKIIKKIRPVCPDFAASFQGIRSDCAGLPGCPHPFPDLLARIERNRGFPVPSLWAAVRPGGRSLPVSL